MEYKIHISWNQSRVYTAVERSAVVLDTKMFKKREPSEAADEHQARAQKKLKTNEDASGGGLDSSGTGWTWPWTWGTPAAKPHPQTDPTPNGLASSQTFGEQDSLEETQDYSETAEADRETSFVEPFPVAFKKPVVSAPSAEWSFPSTTTTPLKTGLSAAPSFPSFLGQAGHLGPIDRGYSPMSLSSRTPSVQSTSAYSIDSQWMRKRTSGFKMLDKFVCFLVGKNNVISKLIYEHGHWNRGSKNVKMRSSISSSAMCPTTMKPV